jgi:hypothetical protein
MSRRGARPNRERNVTHKVIFGVLLGVLLAPPAQAQTGKHVAVGAGIKEHYYINDAFHQRNPSPSFIYRARLHPDKPDGWTWEPKGGLGWFRADSDMGVGGTLTHLGKLRSRPLMGGIERAYRRGPMKVGTSIVGGPAFNHFSLDQAAVTAYRDRLGTDLTSIKANKSLAVRPELSLWYDLSGRFALHSSVTYLYDRPKVKTTASGVTTSQTWKADHINFQVGLAVGLF